MRDTPRLAVPSRRVARPRWCVLRWRSRDARSRSDRAIGYGFVIPVFFVTSGMRLELGALLTSPSDLVMVPLFLLALLVVRGVPAPLYARLFDRAGLIAAALLQATSLPFIVTATQIGILIGLMSEVTATALVCAGLLSVLLFPLIALTLLRPPRTTQANDSPGGAPVSRRTGSPDPRSRRRRCG